MLSVLLGTHPPELPVRSLVHTARLFGVSEGTTRVALSRLVADGDVTTGGGGYRLAPRLVARQNRQDAALHLATRRWDGAWEVAVATRTLRGGAARAALAADLTALRLAEMRPGVWVRPNNLVRSWPASVIGRAVIFEGPVVSGDGGGRSLAASLWDLAGWARKAQALISAVQDRTEPGERFVVATAIVRHLQSDPVLPSPLLPEGWPGARLRQAHAAYEADLNDLLRRGREPGSAPEPR